MINLNKVVNDFDMFHCINRNGFVFTSLQGEANILDAIVVRNPSNCDCWSPKKSFSTKTLEEHIDFIVNNKLEKAVIIADNIEFMIQCPTLKYISIIPANSAPSNFDYSPLYKMPELRYLYCRTLYGGSSCPLETTIDYSMILGLKELHIEGNGHKNYHNLESLEQLYISNEKNYDDLQKICNNRNLKRLWLSQSKFITLNGIKNLKCLQELCIDYMKTLEDISEIEYLASSLRSLSINNCPKIKEFLWLGQMVKLEHLELSGKNELNNLDFLKNMPSLKTFVFSMLIRDGDLTQCLNVPYVYSAKNRNSYNLKDKDLPKRMPSHKYEII